MPAAFEEERRDRLDLEYMKSMYPDVPRRSSLILRKNATEWNMTTVMVYDEYPDRLQLRMMSQESLPESG